jgi:DNA-binding NtrC family response regulator
MDNTIWSVTRKTLNGTAGKCTMLCFRRLRFVDTTGGGAITYTGRASSPPIASIYRSTNFAHVKERIESYRDARDPVLISGERGLGKEDIAFLLNRERPMMRIDCNNLTLDSFHLFIEEGFQRIFETNVSAILLANVDVVAPEIQEALADFLSSVVKQGRIRIISTAWEEIYRKVSRGGFSSRLYHLLSDICIDVPPLRSFIEEVDEVIAFIISSLNIELGTQIIGIRKDALNALKKFEWRAYLQQFIDVLRRSMRAANSSYISINEVQRMLETQKNIWSSSRGAGAFWKGTLEVIEKWIIRGILEDEGMNQTKAAKRLGISRSTLWKKMK